LFQVGQEFTKNLDLDNPTYLAPTSFSDMQELPMSSPPTHRDAVISSLVFIHESIEDANRRLLKQQGLQNYLTPRHYHDFIQHLST
jgi:dynein heavy chain 1